MPQTVYVRKAMEDEQAAELAGTLLGDDSYDAVYADDVDVLTEEGEYLLRYRRDRLSGGAIKAAHKALTAVLLTTNNRGMAGGPMETYGRAAEPVTNQQRTKKDGTLSRTSIAKQVASGIIGYFDRNPRFPYCRQTAFNIDHPDLWAACQPLFREVDGQFRELMPDRHQAQMERVQATEPAYVIHGTAFTTVTVNRNFRTAVHQDAGDLPEGFGVLTMIRGGTYTGGYLVFPQYRVAVDCGTRGILCANVHQWHGNTEIVGRGIYERMSLVFYYRSGMVYCGTPEEERARAASGIRTKR